MHLPIPLRTPLVGSTRRAAPRKAI
ncbi:hypothetical protein GGD61_005387 [Bradyrhizobium sp. SBR1B]|nr:hypothetical protein [Bradyrhizobium sp. SBR1B]